MKTFNLILLLCLTAFVAQAQQREQRNLDYFNSIEFEGRGDLILTPSGKSALEIEAEDGVDMDRLKTYVRGRTLHIEYNRDEDDVFDLHPKFIIYVAYQDLKEVICAGIVDVKTTEPIVSGNFHFGAEGMGNNRLEIEADRLTVEIAGTANLKLKGRAFREVIVLEGTGTLDAFDLLAEEVAAEINGTGSVFLHATERLLVEANGFGAQVKYKGNPAQKNINKSGWVSIKQVASN